MARKTTPELSDYERFTLSTMNVRWPHITKHVEAETEAEPNDEYERGRRDGIGDFYLSLGHSVMAAGAAPAFVWRPAGELAERGA